MSSPAPARPVSPKAPSPVKVAPVEPTPPKVADGPPKATATAPAVVSDFLKEMETKHGLKVPKVFRNAHTSVLYEEALKTEKDTVITSTGALTVSSGKKTGRSPGDKRVVTHDSLKDIWWGKVNIG